MMDSINKIEMIRYALNRIHVRGQESLEGILAALRSLKSEEQMDFSMIKAALNHVTVSGEDDINHLLACLQFLDDLIEEKKESET